MRTCLLPLLVVGLLAGCSSRETGPRGGDAGGRDAGPVADAGRGEDGGPGDGGAPMDGGGLGTDGGPDAGSPLDGGPAPDASQDAGSGRTIVTEPCARRLGSCTSDLDCRPSGCGGETCAPEDVYSTCDCVAPEGSCGCVAGACAWYR